MTSAPAQRSLRPLLLRGVPALVGLGLGVVLILLLLRTVSPGRLGDAFGRADWRYLMAAFVPFVLIIWIKVVRWSLLFGSDPPPFRTLFGALNAGYAANTLVPLRMGELVTAYWIRDYARVPMMRSLTTIAVERISDGVSVCILLVLTAPTVAFPSRLVGPAIAVGSVLALALVAVAFLVYLSSRERHFIERWLSRWESGPGAVVAGMLRQALEGLAALRDVRSLLLFGIYTAVIWVSNSVLMWLICRAFGLQVPLIAGFLLTGVLYLGMAVPSSPGYLGVFDYLMVITLGLYNQPHALSVAAALAAHAINFIPVTIVGLVYLGRQGFTTSMRLVASGGGERSIP